MPLLQPPADQAVRDRFVTEIDANFALNCSAGSGKTRGISDRVAAIAQAPDAEERLARLVVVTFTKKAAEEMQSRARERLLTLRVPSRVHQAFGQSYFGTIHSFAVSLLQAHGHLIGVPSSFDVVDEANRLSLRFLQSPDWRSHQAANPLFARVLRHITFGKILKMAMDWDATRSVPEVGPVPGAVFGPIYTFALPKRADTRANIEAYQQELRRFEAAWLGETSGFHELPPIPDKGGAAFIEAAELALTPVASWLQNAAAGIAGVIFLSFRRWRVAQGLLTYDDQVALAAELLKSPAGRKAVRERNLSVILDEAQDTDPEQFDLLLDCSLPLDADGGWRDGFTPAPGRFSMVGDMQQSIYSARADLDTYRRVQSYLTADKAVGESLTFEVTFRVDQAILDTCNAIFPASLTGANQQVPYVPLRSRPGVGQGQVIRLPFTPKAKETAVSEEAEAVAEFLSSHKPAGLRARNWGQIAILTPRKDWFGALRQALLRRGIRSVQLSQAKTNQESPAYAWLTAVCTILSDPRESFEIVGVLRELYGIADRDLAMFCEGKGRVWQIAEPTTGDGLIPDALNELNAILTTVHGLPLHRAVSEIDRAILRPRLRALSVSEYGDLDAELEPLIALSAAQENNGLDLRAFAEHLRSHLGDLPTTAAASPDCVNILTCWKAKGLEWDCVIVPYLNRKIEERPNSYPAMVGPRFSPARFAFNKQGVAAANPNTAIHKLHELQRLMYVTLTRARETLVIVDDQDGKPPAYSMSNAILGSPNEQQVLRALPEDTVLPAIELPAQSESAPLAMVDLDKATAEAKSFRQKLNPHEVHELSPEDAEASAIKLENGRLRSETATIPLLYGIWWHDTLKFMPWNKGVDAMEVHFATALGRCPDAERGRNEWTTFTRSSLCKRILAPGTIRLAEAPFSTQIASGQAVEGVMDLAVFTPGSGWLIVDWKTGVNDTEDNLVPTYGNQLRFYRDSVASFTGESAQGILYGTKIGALAELPN